MAKLHKNYIYFILASIVFLFSGSLFTAMTLILSLHLGGLLKYSIIVTVLLIPVLFILAEILYRHYDNLFTRIIYLVSSWVGGLFLYWFVSSFILAIIYIVSLYVYIPLFHIIPVLLYSLSTLFFIIGIFQSYIIKITKYDVKVPTKYSELVGKKFVLVADTHFGAVNQEIFARRVFRRILEQSPDAILFPGDMFDSVCYMDDQNLINEIKVMTSKVPVFFTSGNHEQYGPFNHFIQIAEDGGMTVLKDEVVRFLGIPIFGLNFKQRKNMFEVEKVISENISPEHPSIVLNHEPVFHDLLEKAGAFLVVSGHTHNGQFWPGSLLNKLFFYKNFTYGLHKIGNLTSITTSGVGTWGPPLRTFNTPEIVVIDFV